MENYMNIIQQVALDDSELPDELLISQSGRYTTYYAPFENVNESAQVVICGITPGSQQTNVALQRAKTALNEGQSWASALASAKACASFAGAMRKNLADMLDHIRLNEYLRIRSCAELFDSESHLVHHTSALRNPVFENGKNFSGGAAMTTDPYLWQQIEEGLSAEIARLSQDTLYIPLGTGVDRVFEKLINNGVLPREQVLFGLPHASGANSERIAYFCERKAKENLSSKTNAEKIDQNRSRIRTHVQRLMGQRPSIDFENLPQKTSERQSTTENKKMDIQYRISRGKQAGTILTPHEYADGSFVVSKTRFAEDQINVKTTEEIKHYIDRGYSLRMSDPKSKKSPSLIKPESIEFRSY
jgi:hypothetical protein